MSDTTQLNFRIPTNIKDKAQDKAHKMWTNLNFLVKLFLSKFVSEDIVLIQQDVDIEKIFDEWTKQQFLSPEGKQKAKKINDLLQNI